MFVQCLRSKELWWVSGKKKKRRRSHIWGFGIENMASFSQLRKIMLRRAENLARVLSFF